MSGAEANFLTTFEHRGEELYVEGSQCQNCHGPEGTGGQAPYTILDAEGEFVAAVNWRAPALDTVLLRYSRDEVEYIINYGRPFSPMPGWGAEVGKGPLSPSRSPTWSTTWPPSSSRRKRRSARPPRVWPPSWAHRGGRLRDEIDEAIEQIDYDDPKTGEALFTSRAAAVPSRAPAATRGVGRSSTRARTRSARPMPTSATSPASPTAAVPWGPT